MKESLTISDITDQPHLCLMIAMSKVGYLGNPLSEYNSCLSKYPQTTRIAQEWSNRWLKVSKEQLHLAPGHCIQHCQNESLRHGQNTSQHPHGEPILSGSMNVIRILAQRDFHDTGTPVIYFKKN